MSDGTRIEGNGGGGEEGGRGRKEGSDGTRVEGRGGQERGRGRKEGTDGTRNEGGRKGGGEEVGSRLK